MSVVAKSTTSNVKGLAESGVRTLASATKFSVVRPEDRTSALSQVWHLKAACRGPNQTVFYPPSQLERRLDRRRREARAKEICQSCPVQTDCLSYAFQIREQHGIWGGLTEKERRLLVAQGDG